MSTTDWVDAMSTDDLPTDDVKAVAVAGRDVALYTLGDAVSAPDNTCTPGQARLCDGFLDGHEIECPLHQGKFDVRDGKPLCEPAIEALRSYLVKIEAGRVLVQID